MSRLLAKKCLGGLGIHCVFAEDDKKTGHQSRQSLVALLPNAAEEGLGQFTRRRLGASGILRRVEFGPRLIHQRAEQLLSPSRDLIDERLAR